ncbi:MAG TPA: arginine--tRNA ligase [Phycisphaeraceae bacterium]
MPDLQATLEDLLRQAVAAALGPEHAQVDPQLRPAGQPQFGDYQANLAMSLAKQLGRKPRDLAQAIVDHLHGEGLIERADVAGPGFINLRLTQAALDHAAAAMLDSATLGVEPASPSLRVVVDYSSPNVAKEMHVGHLRSTVIGDAIARLLGFLGHEVIRQNHLGDWGTQFGMLIEHYLDSGAQPGELARDIADLTTFYQQAKQKFDADPAFADRARQRVVALQSGDPDTLSLWRELIDASYRHFRQVYERLDVLLDENDIRGESFYNDQLPHVIEDLERVGLLRESQGALVVYPEGFADREGEPLPMIVRKSDGGYLYATTDLAAARYRIDTLGARWIIYVTDARQSQHFAMLFQTLRQAGWASDSVRLDHVAFGAVLGPDRKPFKTRQGGLIRLSDLLDEAEARAMRIVREKGAIDDPGYQRDVAHAIGIGALKYADLASDRIKDYVFDWDRMLALDGNTAPYLQNAYVRIRSIFRKGNLDADHVLPQAIRLAHAAERQLALKLLQFPRVIAATAQSLEPHRLCNYLYELATAYHQFYEQCPVLSAPDDATRDSRLALCELVARTLKQGLSLLGIDVVEQM